MGRPIIKVENLGKRYRIGGSKAAYTTLRERIVGAAAAPWRSLRTNVKDEDESTLWALKDVNFEVEPGEVVGIIGHNGAGKSTLLKIMTQITTPTTGAFELYGRVASLLEVGTGFHNELTGRENVYLNGAILGMTRNEIKTRFDQIVAFSEVEKFIDTPVKFYSSGMMIRLAFSVAAHLEPEILIVDEVLAVGDVAFQRKCLNKMQETHEQGRTVLFVSHNMQAVTRLCSRCLLLDGGRVVQDGPAGQVVGRYLKSDAGTQAERQWTDAASAPGNEVVRLLRVRAHDKAGHTVDVIDIRKPIAIEMTYEVLQSGSTLTPTCILYNDEGICVFATTDLDAHWRTQGRAPGCYSSTVWIPANFLAEGNHFVTAAAGSYSPLRIHFNERDTISFLVIDTLEGDSARGDIPGEFPGVVRPLLEWKTERQS